MSILASIADRLDDATLVEVVLTVCLLIQTICQVVPTLVRKKKGFQGPFWSLPPSSEDDVDTLRDSPQGKRKKQ